MSDFARQIFYGLLVEFFGLLVAYLTKNKPKIALLIVGATTLTAGFIAFSPSAARAE